jgi:hypothetical protein
VTAMIFFSKDCRWRDRREAEDVTSEERRGRDEQEYEENMRYHRGAQVPCELMLAEC